MHEQFTEEKIVGMPYKTMIEKGIGLILEGGGTRSFYSAGVFEAFMEEGIMFPYIVGVSAGISNALSYVSGQKERSRILLEKYVGDKRYFGYQNLLFHGSFFGFDFIYKTIPTKHLFWDRGCFEKAEVRFLTGTTDCITGESVWFEKEDIEEGFLVSQASSSLPFFSKVVKYQGYELLDGGISSPIPIEKSIADANQFHVVVLTRNEGYQKEPMKYKKIAKWVYYKYPRLVETLLKRHEVYNRQLALCEQLEREGKALIIRPLKSLRVGRTERDIKKLGVLYNEGIEEGRAAIRELKRMGKIS